MPSSLLVEDMDMLEDERSHSPALSSADSTGDGGKVRANMFLSHSHVHCLSVGKETTDRKSLYI